MKKRGILLLSLLLSLAFLTSVYATDFLVYPNADLGISIQYPPGWEIKEKEPWIQFSSPPESETDFFRENLVLTQIRLSEKTTLTEYVNSVVEDLKEKYPNINFVESSFTILSGRSAHRLIYTFETEIVQEEDGGIVTYNLKLKTLQLIVRENTRVFIIVAGAEDYKFAEWLPTFEKMTDSFKILPQKTGLAAMGYNIITSSMLRKAISSLFVIWGCVSLFIYAKKRKFHYLSKAMKVLGISVAGATILSLILVIFLDLKGIQVAFVIGPLLLLAVIIPVWYLVRTEESSLKEEKKELKKGLLPSKSGLFGQGITLNFDVGKKEKHKVELYFHKFWGNFNFKIDDKVVPYHFVLDTFSLVQKYELDIDRKEKHHIEVEMKRPAYLAGFRKTGWRYTVSVDGKVIKLFVE